MFKWIKSLFKRKELKGNISDVKHSHENFFKYIKTGDCIAFSGKSPFSQVIKLATRFDVSHVGVAVRMNGELFLVESTTLIDSPDAITNEFHKGVQFQILESRVKNYNGKVYLYPLKKKLTKKQESKGLEWLKSIHREKVSYDYSQSIASGLDLGKFDLLNHNSTYKLFCSELYCKFLRESEQVDKNINFSKYTPKDVCMLNCLEQRRKLK